MVNLVYSIIFYIVAVAVVIPNPPIVDNIRQAVSVDICKVCRIVGIADIRKTYDSYCLIYFYQKYSEKLFFVMVEL